MAVQSGALAAVQPRTSCWVCQLTCGVSWETAPVPPIEVLVGPSQQLAVGFGVLLEAKENTLTLVGSDGQRLAVAQRTVDIGKNYPEFLRMKSPMFATVIYGGI